MHLSKQMEIPSSGKSVAKQGKTGTKIIETNI
jgi:hypothetical protein